MIIQICLDTTYTFPTASLGHYIGAVGRPSSLTEIEGNRCRLICNNENPLWAVATHTRYYLVHQLNMTIDTFIVFWYNHKRSGNILIYLCVMWNEYTAICHAADITVNTWKVGQLGASRLPLPHEWHITKDNTYTGISTSRPNSALLLRKW